MQKGSDIVILDRKEQRAVASLIELSIRTFNYIDSFPLPTQDKETLRIIYNSLPSEVKAK